MTKFQSELVSRAAGLVLGVALVYGGWRCVAKAIEVEESVRQQFGPRADGRRTGNAGPLYLIGGVLLVFGAATMLFVVLPPGAVERVFRPRAPVTGDRPELGANDRLGSHWMS